MDELKNVMSDSSFIPEGCLSFEEEANYIVAAIDEDYEELMESVGLGEGCKSEGDEVNTEDVPDNEDPTVKESAEVLTEKVDIAGLKAKVVKFLQDAWAKIKKAFDDVVGWIKDRVNDAKKKGLDKIASAFKSSADKANFKSETKLGNFHASANVGDTAWMDALTLSTVLRDIDMVDLPAQVLKSAGLGKVSRADIKTMRAGLKERFLGKETEVTGGNLKSVSDDVIRVIKGSQLSEVKGAYNTARKVINGLIKDAKSWKKVAGKGDDKDEAKEFNTKHINFLRRASQLLATGVGVQLDAIRTQNREAFTIATRIMLRLGKKNKKDKKKEETISDSANIFAW